MTTFSVYQGNLVVDDLSDIERQPSGGDEVVIRIGPVHLAVCDETALAHLAHLLLDAYIAGDRERATEAQDWIMDPFRVGVLDPAGAVSVDG